MTGAQLTAPMAKNQLALLRDAGQIPMYPPNVAGWPGGPAWFASATMVARTNLAALVARATPDGPVLEAANGADPAALAAALALPSTGFGAATSAALAAAKAGCRAPRRRAHVPGSVRRMSVDRPCRARSAMPRRTSRSPGRGGRVL